MVEDNATVVEPELEVAPTPAPAKPRKEPKDRLKPAAQREAEGDEEIPLTWQGFYLTIPASVDDWDVDVLEAFETGKAVTAVRGLMGSKTYDELKAHFRKEQGRPVRVKDIAGLMEDIAKTAGFETAGE